MNRSLVSYILMASRLAVLKRRLQMVRSLSLSQLPACQVVVAGSLSLMLMVMTARLTSLWTH